MGGVPRRLAWVTGPAGSEWAPFCAALGSAAEPADDRARSHLRAAHAYLERSFMTGQAVLSPAQLNEQLDEWLGLQNGRPGPGQERPPVALAAVDRRAMSTLPAQWPEARWRIQARVTDRPYISFDSNDYSVDSAAMDRLVWIIADLDHVEVRCDDELVAHHPRAWSRSDTITDPAHRIARPRSG
jgi:hypothetical protein